MSHHKIELTAHHLQRFAATSPLDAVSELIWNALDADADRVIVTTEFDVLDTMTAVTVADNGTGIPFGDIVERFKKLGDSWKRTARFSKAKQRFLHGKDGQGRFKALSLGRVVEWSVVYADGGRRFRYQARLMSDDPTDLIVSDAPEATDASTGVRVRITELSPQTRLLQSVGALDRIGERFALYLNQYHDVQIAPWLRESSRQTQPKIPIPHARLQSDHRSRPPTRRRHVGLRDVTTSTMRFSKHQS